jgi:1,4-dihydroxy-6-naphthoate synthase
MDATLRLGISTCPNDTFAFHALLCGAVEVPGLRLEIELHDVEQLNEALAAGRYDVAKGSFAAAFGRAADLWLLRSGAALGFGNGPLLLAPPRPRRRGTERRVLGPGRLTTAHLLFRLFHPEEVPVEQVVFSEILPALARGAADLGICIHEGRFTYREHGLVALEDLGHSWQERSGLPLPLGGIFARRDLAPARIAAVEGAIRTSLEYARAHPEAALVSMRRHAQEQSDEVLRAHVELYVNEHTADLGTEGLAAVQALEDAARAVGWIDPAGARLAAFGDYSP